MESKEAFSRRGLHEQAGWQGEQDSRLPLLLVLLCLVKSQGLFTTQGWKGPLQKQADKSAEEPGTVDQAPGCTQEGPRVLCVYARQDLHSLNHILSPKLYFN